MASQFKQASVLGAGVARMRPFITRTRPEGLRRGKERRLAFAGAGNLAQKVCARMDGRHWMGAKVVGVYDDRAPARLPDGELSLQGNLTGLVEDARRGRVDDIYITLPTQAEQRVRQLISDLSDTTASVYVIPDFFGLELSHARWFSSGGVPVVGVFESPFRGVNAWLKRVEDIVLGSLILALIAPLLLLIAAGVKLSSPGPVIFRQRRYGLNGEVVPVWKFRSMSVCEDGNHIQQATKSDARITPFGAFLRRTSLDELPQFINVLQGGMSIVGPRPHAVAHNEQYRKLIPGYMLRHKVKPGITGWAQVNGWRGETDTLEKMEKRVEFDLAYMRNWSLWLDIKIVFLTVFRGFLGKNAY
jgi:putative colanic acid biosynthesis UDP-glucose lipid carrier transferase